MDYGIHLPQLGRQATRDGITRMAQRAEELGFHSVWTSDHVAWPSSLESRYPYSSDGSFPADVDMAWLDPLGTLFFVAACTQRVRLGTSVLILGYRWPVHTAKAVASLDVLSGGRMIFGVGVGWMREEFEVLGMPFDHRGARADEHLELYQAFFRDPRPSYRGRFYDIAEVGFNPKPLQSPLPIWVGGDSEAAFKRAARFGHAFHAAFQPLDEVRAAWGRVRELAAAAGRDPDDLRLSIRLNLDPDGRMDPVKSVAGSAGQMAETVRRWAEIGVDHVLLDPVARGGLEGRIESIERFMADAASRI